jgi:hypothetical protein
MNWRFRLAAWLTILGALHAVVGCAGFFAPYDPVAENRGQVYQPPVRLRFVDLRGHFHTRPFFYPPSNGTRDEHEEETARPVPRCPADKLEPVPSWGNLLSSLQQYSVLMSYWWLYAPAVAMIPFFLGYLRVTRTPANKQYAA